MLKDGFVLTVICLLAVTGIVVWWTQGRTQYGPAPGAAQIQQPEPAAAPTPPVAKKVLPIHKAPPPAPVEEQPAVAVSAAAPGGPEVHAAAPAVQPDPPPFPGVEQIARGVHEDSITGKYGDPAISAVTSDGGHLVET